MKGYVANTDYDWFTFLRERSPLDEVNFWQPGGNRQFRTVPVGSPFFFKLKKPYSAIAGFGLFASASILPSWLAWDSFEQANGAPDFATMTRRIEKYRRGQPRDPHGQYNIGCLMISQPVFFNEEEWVRLPRDWADQTVQGKTYDLAEGEGRRIYEACMSVARSRHLPISTEAGDALSDQHMPEQRHGKPILVRPRLGQGTFRVVVTDAYTRACAVTGEHSLPALEAAHIRPYANGGAHEISNGLLLRSDIHRLFDRGYVTVTSDLRFEVSPRLKTEFENGRSYYQFDGQRIHVPAVQDDRPDTRALEWHNERFLG